VRTVWTASIPADFADDGAAPERDASPGRATPLAATGDAGLVDAANRGDEGAFEALYHRHREWVVTTANRIVRNRDDALDVLQETFCYWFRKFPGFRLTAKVTTFLYPVVRNLALERLRKRGKEEPTSGCEPLAEPSSGIDDDHRDLRAAMSYLSDTERELLALRFSDEMQPTEIARTLSMPVGTVKSRLHRALVRLREILSR